MPVNFLSFGLYYTNAPSPPSPAPPAAAWRSYKCEVYLNLVDFVLANPSINPVPPPPGLNPTIQIRVISSPGARIDILQTLVFDWQAAVTPRNDNLTVQVININGGAVLNTKNKQYAQAEQSSGGGGGNERDKTLKRAIVKLNFLNMNLTPAEQQDFKNDL